MSFSILWLLLTLQLTAQVSVSLSPAPQSVAARLLGKRVAKQVTVWYVSIQNESGLPITIAESAVLHRVRQTAPIDHLAMTVLIQEAARNSGWARAGRVSLDLSTLAAFIGAGRTTTGNTLRWGNQWMYGIAAVNAMAPYIVGRFRGQETPVQQNFEALAWTTALQLQPGDSASTHVFTAASSNPLPIAFVMDATKAQTMRELR